LINNPHALRRLCVCAAVTAFSCEYYCTPQYGMHMSKDGNLQARISDCRLITGHLEGLEAVG
jgi:hypothetical protein